MRKIWIPAIALLALACGESDGSPADAGTDTDGDGGATSDCSIECRFLVNNTSDGGDGTTWLTAFARIQEGVDAAGLWAAECGAPCQVWVAHGPYRVFESSPLDTIQLKPDVHLYGGFYGSESTLDDRDPEENITTLNGAAESGESWVDHVVTGADSCILDGFTITNDADPGFDGGNATEGRGLYHTEGSMTVSNCAFSNNVAKSSVSVDNGDFWGYTQHGQGGAISSSGASLSLTNCVFNNNESVSGGAIYSTSILEIANCVFESNRAKGTNHTEDIQYSWNTDIGQGGAIFSSGTLMVSGSEFTQNSSTTGGGVRAYGSAVVTDSLFYSNHASGTHSSESAKGAGGALSLYEDAEITNCVFTENSSQFGGAIHTEGSLTLSNSEFVDNSAITGGAVFAPQSSVSINVIDSLLLNNTATFYCEQHYQEDITCNAGGAISSYGAAIALESCILSGNEALVGGAFHTDTPAENHALNNSVFHANTATNTSLPTEELGSGAIANVEGDSSGATVTNAIVFSNNADDDSLVNGSADFTHSLVEGGWEGVGNIDADPLFVDAESGDFRLQAGSPCIDAADGEAAPEHDIDGNPRVDDPDSPNTGIGPPWADMGAYEYQP